MRRIDGYVLETEYVQHFCREMGPASLDFIVELQGITPPPLQGGFSYCDLGCGQGVSANIFAACHPEGEFHGIDFNQAHVERAGNLAARAGLTNIKFWQSSFAELDALPLPDFDFIALHGVYAWVDRQNRTCLIDFIRRKLKPGGIVYVSYNSLPGWSAVAPIRQLLLSGARMGSGNLEDVIRKSLGFVDRLKAMDISYFGNNPGAGRFYDTIRRFPVNYLAHEYFNEYWEQFYHFDIVKDFERGNVAFAASADMGQQFEFLVFSEQEQQLLHEIADSAVRETIKDFAVTPLLRKDIFVNGYGQPQRSALRRLTTPRRLALLTPRNQIAETVAFPRGDVNLDQLLYLPVLAELEQRPCSLDELQRNPLLSRLNPEKIEEAVLVLLAAGHLLPAVEPSRQAVAGSRLLNYALIETTALKMEPLHLASPVVQSGIQLDWVQRLLLLCELTRNPDPLSFVASIMREQNLALVKENVALQSWDETIEELQRQATLFYSGMLPLLRRLGAVD